MQVVRICFTLHDPRSIGSGDTEGGSSIARRGHCAVEVEEIVAQPIKTKDDLGDAELSKVLKTALKVAAGASDRAGRTQNERGRGRGRSARGRGRGRGKGRRAAESSGRGAGAQASRREGSMRKVSDDL